MIPLIPKSNTFNVNKFFSIFGEWQDCRDVYHYGTTSTVEFPTDREFPVFDFSDSADIINSDSSAIKFFVNLHEGSQKVPDWIVSLPDLDPSVHYVIITADNFDAQQLILKNRFQESLNYSTLWFPYFLYWLTPTDFFSPLYNFPSANNNKFYTFSKEKEIDFLALLGAYRHERAYLAKHLKKKFSDCSAVSHHGLTYGVTDVFTKDVTFDRSGKSCTDGVPVTHNRSLFSAGKVHTIGHSVPLDLFNLAHLQIVAETQAGIDNHDNFFVTEKTTKALFTGIPFVILGSKDYLKNLKKLGFMTYESLWNEDYDSLSTWKQRADAIISLLHQLKGFDWQAAMPILREIHYNNLMILANRNKFLHKSLLDFEQQLQEVIHRVKCS